MRWFWCLRRFIVYVFCRSCWLTDSWLTAGRAERTGESGRRAGSSYLFFMNIYLLVHLSAADDRNYMWLGRPALNLCISPMAEKPIGNSCASPCVRSESVFTLTVADQTLLSWVSFLRRLYRARDRRASHIKICTLPRRWWATSVWEINWWNRSS